MKGWASLVGCCGVAIALATGAAAQDARERTLVVAVPGTPASLDGEQALTSEGEMMMANVHGGDLFAYKIIEIPNDPADSVDLKSTDDRGVTGLLADVLADERRRQDRDRQAQAGVKSPYGNEFDADDYVWSWARRFAVKGVGKFMADVLGIDGPDSVEKVDQHTVPDPPARHDPDLLQDSGPELLRRAVRCGRGEEARDRRRSLGQGVAAHPFRGLRPLPGPAVVPGVETVLVKNPNWQGQSAALFRAHHPQGGARIRARAWHCSKAGQIDIAWGLNERELREVKSDAKLQVVRAQSNKQLYLGLVTDKPPFDNKTLRQAMAWATPYDDIIDKVYFGNARRMTSTVPDIYAGYVSTYALPDRPREGEAADDRGGLPGRLRRHADLQRRPARVRGDGGPGQEQLGAGGRQGRPPGAAHGGLGRAEVWQEAAGLRRERAVALERRSRLLVLGLSRQWPNNFINGVDYNNPEYNKLLEQVMRMMDSPEREQIAKQLQEIAADEVPWVQVAWFDWTVASKKDLTGFLWTPDNQIRFAYVRRQ